MPHPSAILPAMFGAIGVTAQQGTGGVLNWFVVAVAVISIVTGIVAAAYAAKNRAELSAAKGSANAWREERDAERAKAERLEQEMRDVTSALKAAEARTNITGLERQNEKNHRDVIAILEALKTAVVQNTAAVELVAKQSRDNGLESA